MLKSLWTMAILVLSLIVGLLIAAIPAIFFPAVVVLGIANAVLLYRIGNSLEKGFNEHIKAMQAIYDETVHKNPSAKSPPAPQPGGTMDAGH